jgi:hypothetical protein
MRRIIALSCVAVLALSACGDDDTSSNGSQSDDTTSDVAEGSGNFCNDIAVFMEAFDAIPAETPEETAEKIEVIRDTIDVLRESNPESLNVDYDAIENVLNELIDILEPFDFDIEAAEADEEASERLAGLSQSSDVLRNFTAINMYYGSNCRTADTGS